MSVIVPVFNASPYLRGLLESLGAQTLRSLEIIIVDDGSTDDSPDIIRAFAAQDDRVRTIRRCNGGVSAARNSGLDVAKGRWIAFADADDWVPPDTYRSWLDQAEGAHAELLVGECFRFHLESPSQMPECRPAGPEDPAVIDGKQWIREAVGRREWGHYVFLQIARAELIQAHALRFVEGIIHEDVLWTAHIALAARRVCFQKHPRYGYRMTAGSLSGIDCKKAAARRAASYFVVIEALLACAARFEDDRPTQTALRQQAGLEAKHLYKLITDPPRPECRAAMARQFVDRDYPGLIRRFGYGNWARRGWRGFKARLVAGMLGRVV